MNLRLENLTGGGDITQTWRGRWHPPGQRCLIWVHRRADLVGTSSGFDAELVIVDMPGERRGSHVVLFHRPRGSCSTCQPPCFGHRLALSDAAEHGFEELGWDNPPEWSAWVVRSRRVLSYLTAQGGPNRDINRQLMHRQLDSGRVSIQTTARGVFQENSNSPSVDVG